MRSCLVETAFSSQCIAFLWYLSSGRGHTGTKTVPNCTLDGEWKCCRISKTVSRYLLHPFSEFAADDVVQTAEVISGTRHNPRAAVPTQFYAEYYPRRFERSEHRSL